MIFYWPENIFLSYLSLCLIFCLYRQLGKRISSAQMHDGIKAVYQQKFTVKYFYVMSNKEFSRRETLARDFQRMSTWAKGDITTTGVGRPAGGAGATMDDGDPRSGSGALCSATKAETRGRVVELLLRCRRRRSQASNRQPHLRIASVGKAMTPPKRQIDSYTNCSIWFKLYLFISLKLSI